MRDVALPRHEELWLLEHVTGRTRAELAAGVDLTEAESTQLSELRERRLAGEPIQYLTGLAPFGPVELTVDARVLIPRPETEQLWERALAELGEAGSLLDLCTGSGCIALATKHERPKSTVVATDVSEEALAVAASNATRLGLDVELVGGDLFGALDDGLRNSFDVIVSNPPYVSEAEWDQLPSDVRDHEPRLALVADDDGLAVVERIAAEAGGWIRRDGRLLIEIGETQGRRALDLFECHGWAARIERDLAGRDRFLIAWLDR